MALLQVARAQDARWPAAAERRFEEAKGLAQQGKFADAARAYREVAEWPEGGAFHERAQALYLTGLMLEDARELERAIETYHEVARRFPNEPFAARSREAAARLEVGGARGLAFERAYQAAWDALYPASDLARRGELEQARPGLEAAATQLASLLRDHRDDPRAKDAAVALADALLDLGRPDEAHAIYLDAVELSEREARKPAATELEKRDVGLKREKLHECERVLRRRALDRASKVLLVVLLLAAASCRPWKRWSRARTRVAASLGGLIGVLSVVAALVSDAIISREDVHEIVLAKGFPPRAAALVGLPGLTGAAVAVAVATGVTGRKGAVLGAFLGALAAAAVAVSLLSWFELFPFLDQEL